MYGRTGELTRLNKDRNNPNLNRFVRKQADKAYHSIVEQMKDKKLMRLRLQLINASRAGDLPAQHKIQLQMRDHLGQEKESGQ